MGNEITATHSQELKSKAKEINIVMLTELKDESLSRLATQKGAQDYFIKGNMDSNFLIRAVCHAVEQKQAEETLKIPVG